MKNDIFQSFDRSFPIIFNWKSRCGINHKYSLIINYLQFDAPLLKLLLINNLAVFIRQRHWNM